MLRIGALIAWCVLLFVFTCVADLNALLMSGELQFRWVADPDFSDWLLIRDVNLLNPDYIYQKVGHIVCFAVLALILLSLTGSRKKAFVLALVAAVLTEILQLYFARDGRLLDVAIDAFGIAGALYFYDK